MAMVPDKEFKNPIFTESPEVSTHETADAPSAPESSTRLPQAAETSPAATRTTAALNRRPLVRSVLKAIPFGRENDIACAAR
jgi:hypothetical protein